MAKKRGRPKGSKNKSTLAKQITEKKLGTLQELVDEHGFGIIVGSDHRAVDPFELIGEYDGWRFICTRRDTSHIFLGGKSGSKDYYFIRKADQ